MTARTKSILATAMLLLGQASAVMASVRRARVVLNDFASVQGDVVTLDAFLPAGADVALRTRAAKIVIARAPQVGTERILTPSDFARAPQATPGLIDQFDIPDRITVVRMARPLSNQEVAAAIDRMLEKNDFPDAALISKETLHPAVPVMVSTEDPGLKVLRMDVGATPGSVRFELWTSGEPSIHPFDVTAHASTDLSNWILRRDGRALAAPVLVADANVIREKPRAPPRARFESIAQSLVLPGQKVSLLLESPGLEVRTPAISLERGARGQWIRVRNLSTSAILRAQVADSETVMTNF
jgi:Chaperone for flagella basal body P-ring formation